MNERGIPMELAMKKLLLAILVTGIVIVSGCAANNKGTGRYDDFAKCLTEQGAKFYGAYWCPHCENQKGMFGNSIDYVNYIECSLPNRAGQTEECIQAGIKSYPTWEFQDGKRVEGVMSFEQLSQNSGCGLGSE